MHLIRCLEEVQSKKNTALIDRQKRENLKQLEVEKAIEKLTEEDRRQKAAIKEKMSKRMENAEQTKRRKEQEYAQVNFTKTLVSSCPRIYYILTKSKFLLAKLYRK